MEDSNANANAKAPADTTEGEQNPPTHQPDGGDTAANHPRRTPFTNLSQVDADLALARTLQEQVFLSSASCPFLLPIAIFFYYMLLVLTLLSFGVLGLAHGVLFQL